MRTHLIFSEACPLKTDLLKALFFHQASQVSVVMTSAPPPQVWTPRREELPKVFALRGAQEKATYLAQHEAQDNGFILTAHTVVAVGRRIVNCAGNKEKATSTSTLMMGRSHTVYTAVVFQSPDGFARHRLATACVHLKNGDLQEAALWRDALLSLQLGHGYDPCARTGGLIRKFSGTPGTVQGLPLFETGQLLRGQGWLRYTD
jgi:septum formation protein